MIVVTDNGFDTDMKVWNFWIICDYIVLFVKLFSLFFIYRLIKLNDSLHDPFQYTIFTN